MDQFITEIYEFLESMLNALITNNESVSSFLAKNVFTENSLIGLNITYNELFLYIGTLIIALLFIIMIVKLVKGLIGLFGIRS